MTYVSLSAEGLCDSHICCAISDKKCAHGYLLKKDWLRGQFAHGYEFVRLDKRAKVFIEFGPSESGWAPVVAPNYLLVNCFWVSGRYKKQGHGQALLGRALKAAQEQGKTGLVTIAGKSKFHFMSDGKWLKRQGFEVCDSTPEGFELLKLDLADTPETEPQFAPSVHQGADVPAEGLVAYYSNRCPFTDLHVTQNLKEVAAKRGLPLTIVHLDTMEKAQTAPSPATIFSLYWSGAFVTTDLSVCMESRFDGILQKAIGAALV